MIKIPTLFLRNKQNMKLVTREVNPEAAWVLEGYGTTTVKRDGTNIRVTLSNGQCMHVEKRRNPTREEKAQGAEPGYVDASRDDPADKHIFAAVDATYHADWPDGSWSCEALGPKIQGGIESSQPKLYAFELYPAIIIEPFERTYEGIRDFLATHPIEGIVWRDLRGCFDDQDITNPNYAKARYAKIKRRDFNLPWPVKKG